MSLHNCISTMGPNLRVSYRETIPLPTQKLLKCRDYYHTGPQSPKKFPYLKSEHLTKGRKERLLAQLELDSDNMQNKFAILVDRARASLEEQNIACSNLKVLVSHSRKNKLFDLLDRSGSINDLFLKLRNYWSFFDYEFLSVIIDRHCLELKPDLKDYVSSFKEYCKRRICEVPADVFSKRTDDEYNLYVKCDHNFDKNTLDDVKKMELKLSNLLDTDLYLLGVEEGCIKLVFKSLCAIATPLSDRQVDELKNLQIFCLESNSVVYFENSADDSSAVQPASQLQPQAEGNSDEDEVSISFDDLKELRKQLSILK